MNEFKQYRRKGLAEMRSYIPGEDLSGVSVSEGDDPMNDLGMIARNPKDHTDTWYVSKMYFEENFELVSA
ncbi:MAG: hypothetical protein ISS57_00600 [Anaerolineales bacterium]|nr:hypothetical protein [Anaerolineales bacterium]